MPTAWNDHFQSTPERQIHPPEITFVTAEGFLDDYTKRPLDITTLRGDWPFAWTYYDEPGNREALLAGRIAHNQLLAAERLYTGLGLAAGFASYPVKTLAEGWQANVWPDHGWGGNQGLLTDEVYHKSYFKSKEVSHKLLSGAGAASCSRSETKHTCADSGCGVQFPFLAAHRRGAMRSQVTRRLERRGAARSGRTQHRIGNNSGEVNGRPGNLGVPGGRRPVHGLPHLLPGASLRHRPLNTDCRQHPREPFLPDCLWEKPGIESVYDKQQKWEVLRTDKFEGGEVLMFTAPGLAWEDPEIVTMANFERTGNHPFLVRSFVRTAVRSTAVREAAFKNFKLRESFHLYHGLPRVDVETEILDWDGQRDRELRVVFPINLDDARLSYEVPFGTVEIGKDELDFSLLPARR